MRLLALTLSVMLACGNAPEESDVREKGASIRLKNFSRKSFSLAGTQEWDLASEDAYIFREGDKESRIVAYNLNFQQFEKGRKTGLVTAERGEIDYKNKILYLSGKVLFKDAARQVSSEKLTYKMEEKLLETNESVVLIEAGATTHCRRGITVNRDTNVQVCRAPAIVRVQRSNGGFEDL